MAGTDAYGSSRGAARDGNRLTWFHDLLLRYRNSLRFCLMAGAAVADIGAIAAACFLGAILRHGDPFIGRWDVFFLLAPTWLLAALALRAYRMPTLVSLGRSISAAHTALLIATGISLSAAFALKVGALLSRLETGYTLVLAFVFLALVRIAGVFLIRRLFLLVVEPRLVVLTDGTDIELSVGSALTTVIDVREAGIVPALHDPRFFDQVGRAVRYVDRVVLAFSDAGERLKWAEVMRLSGLDGEIVVDLGGFKPLALSHWRDRTTLVISRGPLNLGERLAKRAFDLGVAGLFLLTAAPVIALAAVLVKLDTPGPAFFVQERVGRNNRTYRCFKLRTMRTDSTDAAGSVSTSRGDRRVTRVGRFLRRTSIDELPQLFNVLIGDMSLVGPRPHALGSRAEGELFWDLVPDYWSRHSVKPGMTGLAQIRGFRGATHSRLDIEWRVAADLEYINNWSLWLDAKILLMTIRVAMHRNAH